MMNKLPLGLAISLATLVAGVGSAGLSAEPKMVVGPAQKLGNGTIHSFATLAADGAPVAIGVSLSEGALEGLPPERNLTTRCFDLDQNGQMDHGECLGDTEIDLELPDELADRTDIPFRFVMVNWNPAGHPPTAWTLPHFDIHFYMLGPDEVRDIRTGSCGILIDCDDFQRAIKPVPSQYIHADHVDVGEAVGAMGNHLIDAKTPELGDPPATFTHTWIYGAYDGHIIFYETMITHAFLMRRENTCAPLKLPAAWETGGYYPTTYCMRHDAGTGAALVSLEDFVLRQAE